MPNETESVTCHRMSRVIPKEMGGRLVEIECREDQCALWDPLLGCCGDFSVVLQERTNIRAVVSDLIANMAEELTKQVIERDNHEKQMSYPDGTTVEYGKCQGRIEILQKTIKGLRRRFTV